MERLRQAEISVSIAWIGGLHSCPWFLPPANEVWGKVIFLHMSVILFTGGVSAPLDADPHPLDADPPDTVNKRAVRILLECILVLKGKGHAKRFWKIELHKIQI